MKWDRSDGSDMGNDWDGIDSMNFFDFGPRLG